MLDVEECSVKVFLVLVCHAQERLHVIVSGIAGVHGVVVNYLDCLFTAIGGEQSGIFKSKYKPYSSAL